MLIAPILAFTIDRWTKNELREDAVKATLAAVVRDEFRGDLQRIFSYEFLCEHHFMYLSIQSIDGNLVRVTATVEASVAKHFRENNRTAGLNTH